MGLSYAAVQRRFLNFTGPRRKFAGSLAGKLHCRTAVSCERRTGQRRGLPVAQQQGVCQTYSSGNLKLLTKG